jgi:hypothetical protein
MADKSRHSTLARARQVRANSGFRPIKSLETRSRWTTTTTCNFHFKTTSTNKLRQHILPPANTSSYLPHQCYVHNSHLDIDNYLHSQPSTLSSLLSIWLQVATNSVSSLSLSLPLAPKAKFANGWKSLLRRPLSDNSGTG